MNFTDLIKQTNNIYDVWRKKNTFCPALNCYVRISLKGWNHLVGNSKFKKRTFSDKYRRLKLIPYAEEIITKSTTIQSIDVIKGKKYYVLQAMIRIDIKGEEHMKKVKVVIIEDKKGEKIFYSVMTKKK